MINRKALIVGINGYPLKQYKLKGCVNDANAVAELLEYNYDESKNFEVVKLLDEKATEANIKKRLANVFDNDTDIGLFYFSGHGSCDKSKNQLVTYDYFKDNDGLDFKELNDILVHSKCKNKIVILDCCFSGSIGNESFAEDISRLSRGTTILAACREKESAGECSNHGVFTNLLLCALNGGSMDIFGQVTPASIYAYIDSCLGGFEQRPLFKSYVSSFVALRQCKPKMTQREIRDLAKLFDEPTTRYQLDPSYEPTNYEGSKEIGQNDSKPPYCTKEHIKIFSLLQKANRNGLVVPSNAEHMYYAAMDSDTCELTELGIQYWLLSAKKII